MSAPGPTPGTPLLRFPVMLATTLMACGTPTKSTPPDTSATTTAGEDGADDGEDDSGTPASACTGGLPLSAMGATGCVGDASCTWVGDQAYAYLGHAVATGGDLDGDGIPDVVLAATLYDGATGVDAGRITILSGRAIVDGAGGALGLGAIATLEGQSAGASLGSAVAFVGDTDGDGIAELLVGARGTESTDMPGQGSAVLISGAAGSVDAPANLTAVARFTGERAWSRAGSVVAGPGDVDGDGLADLLIAGEMRDAELGDDLQGPGRVSLMLGRTGGFAAETALVDADAAWTGQGATDSAGNALTGGDLNNDGYADVVIGAPYAVGSRGRVYILPGGSSPTGGTLADAAQFLDGAHGGDAFGWSAVVGDLTGDGTADLAVGAPLADDPFGSVGAVSIYAGGDSDLVFGTAPVATVRGHWDDQQLGTGLSIGQPFGPGQPVLAMGAVNALHGLQTHAGRLFLLRGGPDLTGDHLASDLDLQVHGAAAKDYLGRASAFADLNGDGMDELLIGSAYTNTDGRYDLGTMWMIWGG